MLALSPSLPHWPMTVDVSGSMNWIRQLRMSAVTTLPSASRWASSG